MNRRGPKRGVAGASEGGALRRRSGAPGGPAPRRARPRDGRAREAGMRGHSEMRQSKVFMTFAHIHEHTKRRHLYV
ncbi:hypothetical protein DO71_5446 [Burkholderia pseudomallei]|nr:hypothetical protein DO71_5446 [Burkholderia pseudomallei]